MSCCDSHSGPRLSQVTALIERHVFPTEFTFFNVDDESIDMVLSGEGRDKPLMYVKAKKAPMSQSKQNWITFHSGPTTVSSPLITSEWAKLWDGSITKVDISPPELINQTDKKHFIAEYKAAKEEWKKNVKLPDNRKKRYEKEGIVKKWKPNKNGTPILPHLTKEQVQTFKNEYKNAKKEVDDKAAAIIKEWKDKEPSLKKWKLVTGDLKELTAHPEEPQSTNHSFHFIVPGSSVKEKFTWKMSDGSHVKKLGENHRGYELVREPTGEVVAAYSHPKESKTNGNLKMAFVNGSQKLGTEFEKLAVISALVQKLSVWGQKKRLSIAPNYNPTPIMMMNAAPR